ncbi:MAG: hypothetical protein ACRDH2_06500 [Anaerolineales bacterium]
MKTRYLWLIFGLAFFVTLGVIVGQRLSSEAMAVMVGVVAGVAASIPTSLIVVWFATRTTMPRMVEPRPAPEASRAAERAEPRIVVMASPPAPMGAPSAYQTMAGYPPQAYGAYPMQPGFDPRGAPLNALPARRFTVIGGTEVSLDEEDMPSEVVWQR